MHAGIHHSKSSTVIEGLETAAAKSSQAVAPDPQADINLAEIATMKAQIATLMQSAQLLKIQMIQTEAGVQQNEKNIQEVVKSQDDMRNKLADMKSSQ